MVEQKPLKSVGRATEHNNTTTPTFALIAHPIRQEATSTPSTQTPKTPPPRPS
jgi:hypothetical protein